uniref:MIF4G domain-containing protein n=1 Tax=viral metagenome TaxID=1070528 RepID=A0A6C0K3K2_9ZZZZ
MSSTASVDAGVAINGTIAAILALRTGLRDPVISATALKAIQMVQDCLAKGTDAQGWRKPVVDWRGKGGGGARSFGCGRSAPASASGGAGAPYVPVKYTSRFKAVEGDDAVFMVIQDKLNKFSPRNYKETHAFLCQILDSGKTHFLKEFMKTVFQKATREESICPHYAHLLCELTSKYDVLLAEMVERYKAFGTIFDDISEVATNDYKTLLETNSDKAYRKGYAQFLGELIKYNVLDTSLFVATLQSIVSNIEVMSMNGAANSKATLDEYVACLQRIMEAIKTERTPVALALRPVLKERFYVSLTGLSAKNPALIGVSSRSRFTIMGITDILKTF